ncbi:hypothetical protein MANES_13G096000v8 [Manihot esculenta]|uniref:Uncharacterized protein n=1 Tax=Manihot esculenta TaxID=3983 RepID=A0ACB7GM46_MANES|nr:hypothetical protein MANES_13G096000v8 [Manihot esculenta]
MLRRKSTDLQSLFYHIGTKQERGSQPQRGANPNIHHMRASEKNMINRFSCTTKTKLKGDMRKALMKKRLTRIGPEGSRRPSVLAVAESVQRLPEVSRTKINLLF